MVHIFCFHFLWIIFHVLSFILEQYYEFPLVLISSSRLHLILRHDELSVVLEVGRKNVLAIKMIAHSVFLECFSLYYCVKWYFDESQWMASCLNNTSPSDLRLIIWIIQGTEIHLPHVSSQSSSFTTQAIMWIQEQSVTSVWILHKSIVAQTIISKKQIRF